MVAKGGIYLESEKTQHSGWCVFDVPAAQMFEHQLNEDTKLLPGFTPGKQTFGEPGGDGLGELAAVGGQRFYRPTWVSHRRDPAFAALEYNRALPPGKSQSER